MHALHGHTAPLPCGRSLCTKRLLAQRQRLRNNTAAGLAGRLLADRSLSGQRRCAITRGRARTVYSPLVLNSTELKIDHLLRTALHACQKPARLICLCLRLQVMYPDGLNVVPEHWKQHMEGLADGKKRALLRYGSIQQICKLWQSLSRRTPSCKPPQHCA